MFLAYFYAFRYTIKNFMEEVNVFILYGIICIVLL